MTLLDSSVGVTGHQNPPGPKIVGYNPRKQPEMLGQKCSKRRVLSTRVESCVGGHMASNSSRDPKIMGYNPRKRPELFEITNFTNAARVVYRGHKASKSSHDPKIVGYNPGKRTERDEITNFVDASRVVYQGSQSIEILPGSKNRKL